ncbi:hypothetical protein PF008_g15287 [Phytophthora fragariae]|uniref:RxLR effector protein n=1 Tax=Phytophthora fragariae TaxID=53985 RepID=A0A6G0RF31_9STRA|nr:hypothetical protein PF008_g15287 [Phytophthora fragariae]
MQLIHLLFVTMVLLLASSDTFVAASKCGIKTTAAGQVANKALSEDATPKLKLTKLTASDEERTGVNTGAAACVVGGGAVPINGPTGGAEMVTVTTFNGNGVWQRMQKWWGGLFGANSEPSRSIHRLRQLASGDHEMKIFIHPTFGKRWCSELHVGSVTGISKSTPAFTHCNIQVIYGPLKTFKGLLQ